MVIDKKYTALGRSHAMPDEVAIWAGLKDVSRKIKYAVYNEDGEEISPEEKYSVEVCAYDPFLPSYNDGTKKMNKPTMSVIMQFGVMKNGELDAKFTYADLADLIEKDL